MKTKKAKAFDVTGAIIEYEQGTLDTAGVLELFQHLVNTGLAWSLQGHYGRTASALIEAGHIAAPLHLAHEEASK